MIASGMTQEDIFAYLIFPALRCLASFASVPFAACFEPAGGIIGPAGRIVVRHGGKLREGREGEGGQGVGWPPDGELFGGIVFVRELLAGIRERFRIRREGTVPLRIWQASGKADAPHKPPLDVMVRDNGV